MNTVTKKEFDSFPVVNGIKQCPTGDYSNFKEFTEPCSFGTYCSFGADCFFKTYCSFGIDCSFGKRCSFGTGCSFKIINYDLLRADLGLLNNDLTLELMRRDADAHPNPELFDAWADGGPCPYDGVPVRRLFFFSEQSDLWKPGKPEMSTYDLIYAIAKEKKWILPNKENKNELSD
jgi:hypothetical protein